MVDWLPVAGDPALTTSPQQTDVTDTVAAIIGPNAGGTTTTVPPVTGLTATVSGSTLNVSWTAPVAGTGDSSHAWQINAAGQVVHNGIADTGTTGTVELLLWGTTIYRRTSAGAWLLFNGTAWVSAPADPRTSTTLGESPNGTFVPNTTWRIVDATGAIWKLVGTSGSFQIDRTGVSVQAAANVIELLYFNHTLYQVALVAGATVTPGAGSLTDIHGNVWDIGASVGGVHENIVTPGSGSFTDTSKNVWSLNASGHPVINGNVDTNSTCQLIEFINGTVWQEDTGGLWYTLTPTGTITSGSFPLPWSAPVGAPALASPGGGGASELTYVSQTDTIYAQNATSGNWFSWNGTAWVGPGPAPPTVSGLSWSFWNNGVWTSASGDPRILSGSTGAGGGVTPPPPPPPSNNATFFDDFNTLNMYNIYAPAAGQTWQPAEDFGPLDQGFSGGQAWVLNPFNPATPINNVYTVSNSILSMRDIVTPSQFLQACGGCQYIQAQLKLSHFFSQTYGYFEARMAAQQLVGTGAGFLLYALQGGNEIDVIQIDSGPGATDQAGSFTLYDSNDNSVGGGFTYDPGMPPNFDCTIFHQYGVYVTPSTTTFYIDRVQTRSFPTPAGYNVPLYPNIYMGLSDPQSFFGSITSPGSMPITAQFDYVGIWTTRPF